MDVLNLRGKPSTLQYGIDGRGRRAPAGRHTRSRAHLTISNNAISEPVGEFSPRKDDGDEPVITTDDESAGESDDATPAIPPPPA